MSGNQGLNKCVLAGLLFMALCGATAFAAPVPTFSATASGTTTSLTLTASLSIGDADVGRNGNIYLVANTGSAWFVHNGSNWVSWSGGPLPVYAVGPLTNRSIEVVRNTDLSALVGTQVYVGYGRSESDMLTNSKYGLVYTVTPSFTGTWSGTYGTTAFSYLVTQSGNNLAITRTAPISTGITYNGIVSGDSAVVTAFGNGTYIGYSTWTMFNNTTITAVINSCVAIPGFACGAPNGTSLTLRR